MAPTLRVWDPVVRLLHWGLVASMAVSWLGLSTIAGAHRPAGYVALAIIALRVLWGFVGGNRYARFARFVRGPRSTWAYLIAVRQRRAPRYLGHNPLGAAMIIALLASIAVVGLTGWLATTDRFWGDAAVDLVHRTLGWGTLGLVALHVAGVYLTGRRQNESLVRAMLTGRKRAAAARDVD
jgi:cytochrome b